MLNIGEALVVVVGVAVDETDRLGVGDCATIARTRRAELLVCRGIFFDVDKVDEA